MRIVLITGASSGMGAEFARQIDRTEKNIDAIWLIARRQDRLQAVAERLHHEAKVLPMDLTDRSSFALLDQLLREMEAEVGVLVNCAGFGKIGNYAAVGADDSVNMINLNCSAAVEITLTCLPYMKAGDRIIQLCSTAAFQPQQQISVYSATKAFLYSYTRALRMELLPRKIAVLAVCPYWVKDTEFIGIAEKEKADGAEADRPEKAEKARKPINNYFGATTKSRVVKSALRCSRRGWTVCTPGVVCTLDRIFAKLLPKQAYLYIWELLRRA